MVVGTLRVQPGSLCYGTTGSLVPRCRNFWLLQGFPIPRTIRIAVEWVIHATCTLHAQPEMKEGLDGGSEPTNELETPGCWPLQGLWGEVANAGEGARQIKWPDGTTWFALARSPFYAMHTTEQWMFLPILQFFPSISTISSKTIQNEQWTTVSQNFHCLSHVSSVMNHYSLIKKKWADIMLCRLDLYRNFEIEPKIHVFPIDPRSTRESC